LPKIKSPTLVIAGRHDMSTPIAAGEFIRSQIPGASLTILDAAHISNVEQPRLHRRGGRLPDATLVLRTERRQCFQRKASMGCFFAS
jgi:pimeloyl-ACP methyl ester carboxylesterase